MKLDYFLYSCFEYEQTCKALPGKAMGPQRWPHGVAFLDGERDSFRDLGDLGTQVEACLRWYVEQFPPLLEDRSMTMENIGNLTAPAVFFCLDLKILAGADSQNTADALQASDNNAVWETIDRHLDQLLPNFSSHFKTYLRWVFVKKEEQTWDVGSRPPVGRYAPFQRRGRPGDSKGPPRRSGGGQGGRPQQGGRDRHERGQDRDRPRGPRRDAGAGGIKSGGSHADQERAALEAVRTAVDQLRSNPALAEIKLDPSNSFFRRLQHKRAVAEGFHSFSTGEGMQRAVVVTREKQEQEDNP
ncbi:R3H domain-containing nucleic acid-binding protein [Oligoflexus tunisiensis]|uniref:R3H domain-containing nucleic acid-binding protein n=1 Tax=Oligoflexus tunisiensis TaxID=708132 RepID=UPI001C406484|nr:R3H domain-containing nucleic acid-binding protein [Oligoflexus tunisiensis]